MIFSSEIQHALLESSPIPLRVAIIKELDRAERNGIGGVVELVLAIQSERPEVVQPDDGSVELAKVMKEDVPLLKAALRTNFSIEKIKRIESLVCVGQHEQMKSIENNVLVEPEKSDQGVVELSNEASNKSISLIDLRTAILKELDRDAKREPMCALRAADEADSKLREKGLGLYEIDDGIVEFRNVRHYSIDQDALNLVKASLRTNFSREKVDYAVKLIEEFRDRGISGYIAKPVANRSVGQDHVTEQSSRPSGTSSGAPVAGRPKSPFGPSEACCGQSGGKKEQPFATNYPFMRESPQSSQRGGSGWVTWATIAAAIAAIVLVIIKRFK